MPQPKPHKYKRSQRLLHAKSWMIKYTGKRNHYGYAKHFGVSKLCAVIELEMLGVQFHPELKESIKRAEENKRIQSEKLKLKKEENIIESDNFFSYIVGYTSGGAPYGITWGEMDDLDNTKEINAANEISLRDNVDILGSYNNEDDLPF